MDIKIKYMNNISIINIEPNDSIYSLKELISNKFVYPNIDSIRLIYDGNILCDKNKISDSNIFLDKTIHVILPFQKYNTDDDSDLESLPDEDFTENNNDLLVNMTNTQPSGLNQMLFNNLLNQLNININNINNENINNIQLEFLMNSQQNNTDNSQNNTNSNLYSINENATDQEVNEPLIDNNTESSENNIVNTNIDSTEELDNSDENISNIIEESNSTQINNQNSIVQSQVMNFLQNISNNNTLNLNNNTYEEEITTLNEMGFNDNTLNRMILNQTNGNLELAIELLFNY